MKNVLFLSLLLTPAAAFADESNTAAPATAGRPEETVTLSEQATTPLFERVRGTIIRAVKDGKVVAAATTAPARKTN